jgi:hypothetical protein
MRAILGSAGSQSYSTTVEFLLFGPDWTRVAEIRFSENKDLPDDKRQRPTEAAKSAKLNCRDRHTAGINATLQRARLVAKVYVFSPRVPRNGT